MVTAPTPYTEIVVSILLFSGCETPIEGRVLEQEEGAPRTLKCMFNGKFKVAAFMDINKRCQVETNKGPTDFVLLVKWAGR